MAQRPFNSSKAWELRDMRRAWEVFHAKDMDDVERMRVIKNLGRSWAGAHTMIANVRLQDKGSPTSMSPHDRYELDYIMGLRDTPGRPRPEPSAPPPARVEVTVDLTTDVEVEAPPDQTLTALATGRVIQLEMRLHKDLLELQLDGNVHLEGVALSVRQLSELTASLLQQQVLTNGLLESLYQLACDTSGREPAWGGGRPPEQHQQHGGRRR